MAKYIFKIRWEKAPDGDETYSWHFANGVILKADRGAAMIPGIVEPEAAFVASLASCHMLSFMAAAAKRGLSVVRYYDTATGILEKNRSGRIAITRILLQPQVELAGEGIDQTVLNEVQEAAHAKCFIANSITAQVLIESTLLPESVN